VVVGVAVASVPQPQPIVTLVQGDPWRTTGDAPSAAVSADGRYIAFASYAQLVPADVNQARDIYVLDRADGRVMLESVSSTHDCIHPALSGDGRLLVYETYAGSADDDPASRHVVLRDRQDGSVTVVGAVLNGRPARGWSGTPTISHSGRLVAFASTVTDLVAGSDANGPALDVYTFDREDGTVRRISVDSIGVQSASGFSAKPSVSGDGRRVAFVSSARLDGTRDAAHDTREHRRFTHVYVRDLQLNVTRLVSAAPQGAPADGASWAPAMSGDGRYIAFVSAATNLASGDRNASADVFVADLHTGAIELVSRSVRSGTANAPSGGPVMSSDGRFIVFHSEASDLVCTQRCPVQEEDINLLADVFLHDRHTRTMVQLSADARGAWMETSSGPSIDAAGSVVVFSSRRPITASDLKHDFDLFVRSIGPSLTARR
jgi:Tol biopolymer transport system component